MALMVGVSGIRGIIGESLTPRAVLEFAQAYGTFLDAIPKNPLISITGIFT